MITFPVNSNIGQKPNYKKATNAAYKLIAERDLFNWATDVFSIVAHLENCRLYTYRQAEFFYGLSVAVSLAESAYGYSIVDKRRGTRIIFYNENMPLACIRFTLAHEIGHAVLGHKNEKDLIAEKEADCFARNLLCPAPVVNAMQLESASDYVAMFNVSYQMANVAKDFHKTDAFYIDKKWSQIIHEKIVVFYIGYESMAQFEHDTIAFA